MKNDDPKRSDGDSFTSGEKLTDSDKLAIERIGRDLDSAFPDASRDLDSAFPDASREAGAARQVDPETMAPVLEPKPRRTWPYVAFAIAGWLFAAAVVTSMTFKAPSGPSSPTPVARVSPPEDPAPSSVKDATPPCEPAQV